MKVHLAYRGHSALVKGTSSATLAFAPNLMRDPVAFDAALRKPLRFREAISALHDVVISDLRFKKRDKAAYEAWKKAEVEREQALRRDARRQAEDDIRRRQLIPLTPELSRDYDRLREKYWGARVRYSDYLRKHDAELWRMLMPCDPVVTIAADTALFECFSADESSYGCLSVGREDGFGPAAGARHGTTNVDYSWDLFHSFQALRSYRETRFRIDPQGFTVATEGEAEYREEKIDLPPGWLRGFMQIQGAMTLPSRKVSLSREAVYSVIAWHKRHRARTSPRALRFELEPGRAPRLVLEPWERPVVSEGTRYDGPPGAPVRIWGVRRLVQLARLLPIVERVDVHLLGTGLPSFWVAHMGEMTLTLGLSGWTTNDWTRGSALDLLAPPAEPTRDLMDAVAAELRKRGAATLAELDAATGGRGAGDVAAALRILAHHGQAIYDLPRGLYRWRQIMAQGLGEAEMGPENPELVAGRQLYESGKTKIQRREDAPGGGMLLVGTAGQKQATEVLLDGDGRIKKASCSCSHHYTGGLRRGPCRHIIAVRQTALKPRTGEVDRSTQSWYDRLRQWGSS